MHDYAIPNSGGITHVRPGVVGVPTPTQSRAQSEIHVIPVRSSSSLPASTPPGYPSSHHRSAPVPVPITGRDAYREPHADGGAYSFVSGASVSDAWSSPVSVGFAQSSFRSSVGSASVSAPGLGRSFSDGAGGWSMPHSSVRSGSRSRSGSGSGSVDMDEDEREGEREGDGGYVDVDTVDGEGHGRFGFRSRAAWRSQMHGKIEEEEWDGMEMEMEM